MKTSHRPHRSLAVAVPVAAALAACTPGGSAGLTVKATSAASQALDGRDVPVVNDAGDQAFALAAATVHLKDIRLSLPAGVACADVADALVGASCEDVDDSADEGGDDSGEGAEIKIEGPFVVDLVAGTATPSLDDVRVPALRYERVDLRVDEGEDGASFEGTWATTVNDAAVDVHFAFDFSEDIRVEQPGGVDVAAEGALLVQFVVDDWFAGADLGACLQSGEVAVEAGAADLGDGDDVCDDIADLVKDNMKNSLDLGHDSDFDGEDDSEDDGEDDSEDDGEDDNGVDDNGSTDD